MYETVLQEIEADKAWRTIELKKVEIVCDKLEDKNLNKLILKSTIPMIYAHWEGFIVSSLRKVNKFLSSLNYGYQDFHIHLLVNAYEENIKNLENSLAYEKKIKHLNIIFDNLNKEVKFSTKVDVKSNLKFKILEDICFKFNLNIEVFKIYERDLEQLLKVRNSIAHGESAYSFANYQDIEKYVTLLSNLMDTFHIEVSYFLENEKYKRKIK